MKAMRRALQCSELVHLSPVCPVAGASILPPSPYRDRQQIRSDEGVGGEGRHFGGYCTKQVKPQELLHTRTGHRCLHCCAAERTAC